MRAAPSSVDDGVTPAVDSVGAYPQPETVANATLTYALGPLSTSLTTRYFSDSVLNNSAIECQTDCPPSTEANRTYDDIDLKGATYLDLALSYQLESLFGAAEGSGRLYFNIRNLQNKDPELIPGVGTTSLNYIYSRSNGGRRCGSRASAASRGCATSRAGGHCAL